MGREVDTVDSVRVGFAVETGGLASVKVDTCEPSLTRVVVVVVTGAPESTELCVPTFTGAVAARYDSSATS